ncbi:hypothetical protein GQX74_005641 [Glossina fuscipes]|nr:hypothetical protein GQX74_005641 [Glossina fuscipes]
MELNVYYMQGKDGMPLDTTFYRMQSFTDPKFVTRSSLVMSKLMEDNTKLGGGGGGGHAPRGGAATAMPLLDHTNPDTSIRNFNSTVLGYATPVNDFSLKSMKEISEIHMVIMLLKYLPFHYHFPCWFHLIKHTGKYRMAGKQDIDSNWRSERPKVTEFVINLSLQHGFDGIVWEYWSQLIGRADNKFLVNLAVGISKAPNEHNLKLVLVLPPMRKELD